MVCHKWEYGCSRTPFSSTLAFPIELLGGRRLGPQRTLQSNIGCGTGMEFAEEKQLESAEKQLFLSLSLSLSLVWDHQPLWDQPYASFCPISVYILWRVGDRILWALVLRGCLILVRYDWNSWGEKSTQWWLLHFQDHFVSLIAIGLFFCRQSSVATINMICWWGPVSWHLSVVGSCADGKSWTRSQHWLCDFCWRQLLSTWTDGTWGPEVFRFIHWHLHSSKLAENLVYWYISTSPLFPALRNSVFNTIKTPTTIAKAWNDGLTLCEWLS